MSDDNRKSYSERFPGLGRVLGTGKPGPTSEARDNQALEDFLNDDTPFVPRRDFGRGRVLGTGQPGPPLPQRPGSYGTFDSPSHNVPKPFPKLRTAGPGANIHTLTPDTESPGIVRIAGNVHTFGPVETPARPTLQLPSSPAPTFPGTGHRLGGSGSGRSRLIPKD